MTTTRPTPEAIAADIHAADRALASSVIDKSEHQSRLYLAWKGAAMLGLSSATATALAAIEADDRPFGPSTLDVLLAAESADQEAVCDAIEAIAGDGAWISWSQNGRITMTTATLAALVRALHRRSHGA